MNHEERIQVRGTGSQAPYGIGEIIESFAPTMAGLRKAVRYAENTIGGTPQILVPKEIRAQMKHDIECAKGWCYDDTLKTMHDACESSDAEKYDEAWR